MNMSTKTIKISIDDLIDKFKKYNDNEEDIALIRRAYDYAEKKHFGQKRISGDDYILHPLNVALILTEISADAPCMAAALLHDTIEDSDATKEEIEELFGSEVALLVDGVTKINKLNFNTETEASAANQRKILVGLSEDPRVIIIKLADRLHNMRTISVLSVEKQKKKAKEANLPITMIVYVDKSGTIVGRDIKQNTTLLGYKYYDSGKVSKLAFDYKTGDASINALGNITESNKTYSGSTVITVTEKDDSKKKEMLNKIHMMITLLFI